MSMYGGPGYSNNMGMERPSIGGQAPPNVPMSQPQAVFRYGEQAVWSTQGFAGGQVIANSQFRLFTTALNATGQGFTALPLSLAETNLKVNGQLPQSFAFDCYGVALQPLHFSGTSADGVTMNQAANTAAAVGDVINVINNSVLSWDFTQSGFQIAPGMLIGAGGGSFGAISTTQDATDRGHMNNGAGTFWLYNQYPIALPGLVQFAIVLQFGLRAPPIGTNALALRVCLLGYYKALVEIG
jgi:hypothetical protein